MSIDERIKYAENKRNEAIRYDNSYSISFWNGYLDGLNAIKRGMDNGNVVEGN